MKRTLMFENRELLDFEMDPATGRARILDAPAEDDASLALFGLGGLDAHAALSALIRGRCLSRNREDLPEILDSFGARSEIELALKGRGASLTDRFWYRAPGSAERWEDVNFFDNDWDDAFRTATLTGDYDGLAACSPDVPDLTTRGYLRKAWDKRAEGIILLKGALREDGADHVGSLLGSKLGALLFGQNAYQPLSIEEHYRKSFSASPLMLSRDEELVQGFRLFAMCGMRSENAGDAMGTVRPLGLVDVFGRAGVANPSAHVAKMAAYNCLALLSDMHSGNFGVICNLQTGERRAASLFDYDRSFGLPSDEYPLDAMCANPQLAALLCAQRFSDLDPSWDWSWYDPRALDGFEERIEEAYFPYRRNLPSSFVPLLVRLFVIQRSYVNEVAGQWDSVPG